MSWPDIPYERWRPTGASLHMWAQIVGKFRLAASPWLNHSWHATFYVTGRGLTTSLIHTGTGSYEIEFDFVRHRLVVTATSGAVETIDLEPMPVAAFHEAFRGALTRLGAPVRMHAAPSEVPDPVPFAAQTAPGAYDPAAAHDYWRALVCVDRVFKYWRTCFLGKTSPVHLFWGALDLAVTRFSGRTAPLHPGGIPALPDAVTREAYSHEVSSAGFWPGGGSIEYPAFYAYAYPMPAGFDTATVEPPEARFDRQLGEFVLPYDAVRIAPDPDATLLAFLRTTYAAAADLGRWDRTLETPPGAYGTPRQVG